MSFTDQINSLFKSCHFHIRDIRRICHLLPLSAAKVIANSLISSKLDYCNGVTFSQLFSTYRWQHDVVRSNHVTNPRDHNILLLSTICLFIYNHTKEIEFYLFADWLQDLWGRLQFDF